MVCIKFKKKNFDQRKILQKLKGKIYCDIGAPTITIEVTFGHELYILKVIFSNRKLYLLYAQQYHRDGMMLVRSRVKEFALLEFIVSEAV